DYNAVLETIGQRLERLMDAYEAGAVTLEEFQRRRAALDAERARIRAEAAAAAEDGTRRLAALGDLAARVRNVVPLMAGDELDVPGKNAVLASVVDRIVVDRDSRTVRIVWRGRTAAAGG
ncbi:MAG: hypothetical protein IRY95_10675, partial [Clostridia bacterium]|nr:hypothetical protein [Clostridia bacterium]